MTAEGDRNHQSKHCVSLKSSGKTEQRALVAYNFTFWNAMNRANSRSKQNPKLKLFKDLPST